jgi:DNA-binding NarL/FixJ family response regulator
VEETPITIMVVDDHRLMLEGIVRILGAQPDFSVVALAATGDEAVRQHRLHNPDITLMDLRLGEGDGIQAIQAILANDPGARVVVVTMYSGEEDVFRAFGAGACAYILKDAIPEDLVRVIRSVYAGERPVSPHIAAIVKARGKHQPLTTREIEVLSLLAEGKRDKEIAQDLGISPRTTQVHIRSIFSKLEVHDRTAALTTAIRRGIIHVS